MKKLFASCALAVCAVVAQSAKPLITVDPSTRSIRDQFGRNVIFHGVNVVYKIPPYIPSQEEFDAQFSLTDAEIDQLKSWGFNFVRLGVMWEAVERAPGVYNDTYLDQVEQLINKLGQRGIYSLVDAHQDVLARSICGEGMPNFYANYANMPHVCDWTILDTMFPFMKFCTPMSSYNLTLDTDGNPKIQDCQKQNFVDYYFSPEGASLFERIYYSNVADSLQDKFVAYWTKVASRFANNPYVVGYDPINEPFPANIYKNPELIYDVGRFDRTVLQPLYTRIINESYGPASDNKIVFFEPGQFPDTIFDVGFDALPGGAGSEHLHILNDHSYGPCALNEDVSDAQDSICKLYASLRVAKRNGNAQKLGVPLIISEFGACMGGRNCILEITAVADACDANLAHWAYWQYKKLGDLTTTAGTGSEGFYDDDGTLQVAKIAALARPYFQYTQGTLLSMTFNSTSKVFLGTFKVDTSITAAS